MWQTSKICWSVAQDLLLRVASFAARPSAKISGQSTSATRRIPKTFLLRDIPTVALSFLISLILLPNFQKACFGQNTDFATSPKRAPFNEKMAWISANNVSKFKTKSAQSSVFQFQRNACCAIAAWQTATIPGVTHFQGG